ncbi:alpha/beta fold hydrolase [Amycolatopsis panacis]|uniref:Alpha/beta fold hydrolase n=2 Tax=Amycolatopsis panacis TaxID=2340917 RepID=A0A419IBF5_9PSEU|nr:alpha/beta fold hydrolase [Amycolatopsis panacis]
MTAVDRRRSQDQVVAGPALTFTDPVGPAGATHLVLGHSLGTSAALWAAAVPLLARSFRVMCWDLPGHGHSPAARQAFTIGDLSDGIVARLEARGVSSFLYAGVSIGGTVGLDLALRHADRIVAAAIVSSGARVDSPAAWAERAASVRASGTGSLVAGSLRRWFAPSTCALHADRADRLLRALRDTDDESYARACEALADYDVTARLAQVAPPVLALWGQYDQLVPERWSAQIARGVRRGAVRCVPDAAHACPLEQPETVADQLTTFFGSVCQPRPGTDRSPAGRGDDM